MPEANSASSFCIPACGIKAKPTSMKRIEDASGTRHRTVLGAIEGNDPSYHRAGCSPRWQGSNQSTIAVSTVQRYNMRTTPKLHSLLGGCRVTGEESGFRNEFLWICV